MGLKNFSIFGGLLLLITARLIKAQEDSLRSAVNAVDRRQKDLSDESIGDYGYSLDGPEDLSFLSDDNSEREYEKNQALERILLDYLEDGPHYGDSVRDDDIKKRISSSFRERLEEDKERQMEELTQNFLTNLENEKDLNDNDDYNELIRELWEKYRNYPSPLYNHPKVYLNGDIKKRIYYPRFGLDSVGLRKRNKYQNTPNDPLYLYNYSPRNDYLNKLQDDDDEYNWNRNRNYKPERKYNKQNTFSYPTMKRFPVSKRSSNYNNLRTPEITHEHKRSTAKKDNANKTDPKVIKDLSNIFGTVSTEQTTTVEQEKSSTKPMTNKESKSKIKSEKHDKLFNSKEQFLGMMNDKPLQIKKKSINWSDYFGLDRRKKSGNDQLDNEWLMERYHKAVTMANKRNVEYPLQSFKNHDLPMKKESSDKTEMHKRNNLTPEEVKITEMDSKLKTMEDTIIDDALKHTGAHEGAVDSKEIQEVKDKIISRLAAAYSLEKMRRAIGEYKLNIAKEKERIKQQKPNNDDYEFFEDKRVSVPRKQAIDEEREKIPEGDNNIKCAQGDEDCEEQNYRTPTDVLEQNNFDECPRVQRACNEVATILGHYARVFETACNLHQMCLLCSNNSWFAPTRQCNVLFLTKAFELCDGKQDCQKEAQRSVRYLLDVNRTLRMEPLGDCELACPDRR